MKRLICILVSAFILASGCNKRLNPAEEIRQEQEKADAFMRSDSGYSVDYFKLAVGITGLALIGHIGYLTYSNHQMKKDLLAITRRQRWLVGKRQEAAGKIVRLENDLHIVRQLNPEEVRGYVGQLLEWVRVNGIKIDNMFNFLVENFPTSQDEQQQEALQEQPQL